MAAFRLSSIPMEAAICSCCRAGRPSARVRRSGQEVLSSQSSHMINPSDRGKFADTGSVLMCSSPGEQQVEAAPSLTAIRIQMSAARQ